MGWVGRETRKAWALCVGVLLVACSETEVEQPTEMILLVDSELAVPAVIDRVRINATAPGGTEHEVTVDLTGDNPDSLPGTLALRHTGGALGPLRVRAAGMRGDVVVLVREAAASFVPGETRVLRLVLLSACVGVECGDGQTCTEDGCGPLDVPESELTEWGGLPEPLPQVPVEPDGSVGPIDSGGGVGPIDSGGSADDPCVLNPCDPLTTCVSETGERVCGACPAGYSGDGEAGCTDVDECQDDNGGCGAQQCSNFGGGFACLDVLQIEGGAEFTCLLLADGTIRCGGSNVSSELGNAAFTVDGTIPSPSVTVQDITTAVEIAVGIDFACARLQDGRVMCWGRNNRGQLGSGTALPESAAPEEVSGIGGAGPAAIDISAFHQHACAVVEGGDVRCWGRNDQGQLGNVGLDKADSNIPVAVETFPISCAYADNAQVTCVVDFGAPPTPYTGARGVEAGVLRTCVIGSTVTDQLDPSATLNDPNLVRCFGYALEYGLGNGDLTPRLAAGMPVLDLPGGPAAAELVSVSLGSVSGCALSRGGEVRCWGRNTFGQQGNGTLTENRTAQRVRDLPAASRLVSGSLFSCAGTEPGEVYCWGNDAQGQLGDGGAVMARHARVPVLVEGTGTSVLLGSGGSHACSLRSDGRVLCWGRNARGALGTGDFRARTLPTPVARLRDAVDVAAGENFVCAVDQQGDVYCWGAGALGELGNGTTPSLAPRAVEGLGPAVKVVAGDAYACALLRDSSVWCWGSNVFGEQGLASHPTTVPTEFAQLSGTAVDIGAGRLHACAIVEGGAVECWGNNARGQLGNPLSNESSLVPVPVDGITDAAELYVGGDHACVVHADRTLSCFGASVYGEAGVLTATGAPATVIPLKAVEHVAALGESTCASVAADGAQAAGVYCWGRNTDGQLGIGFTDTEGHPQPAYNSVTGVVDMSGGGGEFERSICAVLGDGTVSCWGSNLNGSLGHGDEDTPEPNPTPVSNTDNALKVDTGKNFACAVLDDGTATCWGSNSDGQLGDSSGQDSSVPVPVPSLF